jgi:hypothetical protein
MWNPHGPDELPDAAPRWLWLLGVGIRLAGFVGALAWIVLGR